MTDFLDTGVPGSESGHFNYEIPQSIAALASDHAGNGVGASDQKCSAHQSQSVESATISEFGGGHQPSETHDGSAASNPEFSAVDHRRCDDQTSRVDGAETNPPSGGEACGHTANGVQTAGAAASDHAGNGAGASDHSAREILTKNVGSATISEFGDGQGASETHSRSAVSNSEFSAVDHRPPDDHRLRGVDGAETNPPSGGEACDHIPAGAQKRGVAASENPASAGAANDPTPCDTLRSIVVPAELIAEIIMQWRRRQQWHRAEKRLTLQCKALCRGCLANGDKKEADVIYKAALGDGDHPKAATALASFFPLLEARDGVERHRLVVEKRLKKLAKQLPVAPWVESVRGVSMLGLAAIVGGAGDLSMYGTHARLWKRMGLAVMPDGTRQRRVAGAEGVAHGYSPSRRSEMWNIGNGLIGGMGKGKRPLVGEDISLRDDWSPLEKLFVERLRVEAAKDPENMAREPTKEGKESFSRHAAARAKRYVEKIFLRMLWQAWRGGDHSSIGTQSLDVSAQ